MNRIGREMTEYLALSVLKTIALVWLVQMVPPMRAALMWRFWPICPAWW